MNISPPWLWRYHKKLALAISRIFSSTKIAHPVRAGTEFRSLQEYQPWDAVNKIDRKTTAKKNIPHIKHTQEKDLWVRLLIDEQSRITHSKRACVDQLSYAVAYSLLKQGEKVGVISHTGIIPLSSKITVLAKMQKLQQGDRMIEREKQRRWNRKSLLFWKRSSSTIPSFESQLKRMAAQKVQWKVIVIMTESLSISQSSITALTRTNVLIRIHCFDPVDLEGSDEAFASYHLQSWSLKIKNTASWKQQYQQATQQAIKDFSWLIRWSWGVYSIIRTDQELLPSLLSQLAK